MKKNKEKILLPATISLFLAFTFCVFGPLEIVLSNATEFWFQVTEIIPAVFVMFVLVFVAVFALAFAISMKTAIIYPILLGMGLALYVQGNFILTDYGVMDGNAIDWSSFGAVPVVNTLIWVALIAVPIFLYLKKIKWLESVLKLVSIGCVAMQIITLGTLFLTGNWEKTDGNFSVTTAGINTVSAEENVVVFILDTFDEEYFREIQQEDPDFLESLDGFTHFNNATGMYPTTKGSLPFILTGIADDNELKYADYIREAFSTVNQYDDLKSAGYDIGIFTLTTFFDYEVCKEFVSNLYQSGTEVSSYSGLLSTMYKMTAFRYVPHIFKNFFWFYSGEVEQWQQSAQKDIELFSLSNVSYYNQLKENRLSITEKEKCFRLIHLEGVHPPYTLNENLEEEENATAITEARASLKIVYEYIQQLKVLGVYENTTLIIMADHGATGADITNPIFLVKAKETLGTLADNNAPVSQSDLWATIMSDIGLNEEGNYGKSAFEYAEGDERIRTYYYYTWDDSWSSDYLPKLYEYRIDSINNDLSSYHLVDYKVEDYSIGTEITFFGDDATGAKYCIKGISYTELTHTWTKAKEATIALQLTENVNDDLVVTIALKQIFNGKQSVLIRVNNNTVYEEDKTDSDAIQFVIPKEYIQDGKIELVFELPDAVSPAELGISAGERMLGLALESMIVEDAQKATIIEKESVPNIVSSGINFAENGNCSSYLVTGWHGQESGFRWTSNKAKLSFLADWSGSQTLELEFCSYRHSGDTQVFCNDVLIGTLENNSSFHTEYLTIPEECLSEDGMYTLTFVTENATSPEASGESSDGRTLGIAVKTLNVYPVQDAED